MGGFRHLVGYGSFSSLGDKQIKKWHEGSKNLRVRAYSTKFPTGGKEFKNHLELSAGVHAFIPALQRQRLVNL